MQQLFFQRLQRGVLPLLEASEALGGGGVHELGWVGTMISPVF